MNIRRAQEKDAPAIHRLLSEVLEIHAGLRPDIFVPGTTKYTDEEVRQMLTLADRPVFVAVDDQDAVLGYAFCVLQRQPAVNNRRAMTMLYVDDLCVDGAARGMGIGQALLDRVKDYARTLGCYEVTLNVWEGNSAKAFYEKEGFRVKETLMEYILAPEAGKH
jgi:ribosomal protein S18 acetylase RimI-like enzyme